MSRKNILRFDTIEKLCHTVSEIFNIFVLISTQKLREKMQIGIGQLKKKSNKNFCVTRSEDYRNSTTQSVQTILRKNSALNFVILYKICVVY